MRRGAPVLLLVLAALRTATGSPDTQGTSALLGFQLTCDTTLSDAAAGHLQPIVQRYGSLSGMSASGMQGVLQQLWHHLKHAYDGLAAIQASSQGPFR